MKVLRLLRIVKGLTIEAVVKKADVFRSATRVRSIEQGLMPKNKNVDFLKKLSKFYDVPINILLRTVKSVKISLENNDEICIKVKLNKENF